MFVDYKSRHAQRGDGAAHARCAGRGNSRGCSAMRNGAVSGARSKHGRPQLFRRLKLTRSALGEFGDLPRSNGWTLVCRKHLQTGNLLPSLFGASFECALDVLAVSHELTSGPG